MSSLLKILRSFIALKASLAGATYTGTHDFTGATVTGIPAGFAFITSAPFTAVSAVNVNGCFSATYRNYRVTFDITTTSQNNYCYMRLRSGVTDNTTTNYNYVRPSNRIGSTTTAEIFGGAAVAQWDSISHNVSGAQDSMAIWDIRRPYLTLRTGIHGQQITSESTYVNQHGGQYFGIFNSTDAFDGFSIIASAGTITGVVKVYGYKD